MTDDGDEGEVDVSSEEHFLNTELWQAVVREIEALPIPLRQSLQLRMADVPYPEIAARTGISQENARKRVQQARVALRVRLHDHWGLLPP
jgi:DNA-directed RNA polymerase specialized sigma24 family protein